MRKFNVCLLVVWGLAGLSCGIALQASAQTGPATPNAQAVGGKDAGDQPAKASSGNNDGGASGQAAAAPAVNIEELERQLNDLKTKVGQLNEESKSASRELSQVRTALGNAEQRLFFWTTAKTILHPIRMISPLLANVGFICGAIALLYIVLARFKTAQTLLSLAYPFSIRMRRSETSAQPMSIGARWFWAILLVLILLMLAVPAFSEDAAGKVPPPASETPNKDSAPAADSSNGMQDEMSQALKYAEMTPVERAILILETASENAPVTVVLEKEVLELVQAAATKNNHHPLIEIPTPPHSVNLDLKKGTPGYYVVLASLYEAAGRPNTCETLAKGIQPFTANPSFLKGGMPFNSMYAVLCWLASCDAKDLAKIMIMPAAEIAPDVKGIAGIVEIAGKLGLSDEARKIIEVNVSRVKDVDEIEALSDLAQQKGYTDLAKQALESNVLHFNLETQLRLIKRFSKLGDSAKTEGLLGQASNGANVNEMLQIIETATELDMKKKVEDLFGLAVQRCYDGSDVDNVIISAAKKEFLPSVMTRLQERMQSLPTMMDWSVAAGVPSALGATLLDKEQTSLASIVAANLYAQDKAAALAPLFEQPVTHQLDVIIKSMGAKPQVRINDMYLLARYYELMNSPTLPVTRDMVVLQQRLRGLDKAGASEADAKRLALTMEMEQLRTQQKDLEKTLADTRAEMGSVQQKLSEATIKTILFVLEAFSKALLVIIGLWIALSRAIAAARDAQNWVFSHFCWKFLETIGFECCCTVVMLPAGVPIALLSQDRLKHLHLIEQTPGLPQQPESPPLPRAETAGAESSESAT